MRDERVTFEGSTGAILAGRLRRPAGRPQGWAVLAHCFTCGKDLRAARLITDALAIEGYGVLRFDFTGLGESEGAFTETTFLSNVADLVTAARWLAEREGPVRLLVGHSLGGAAVVAAAKELPDVRGVVTIGAPFDPSHAAHILAPVRETLKTSGEAEIELAGRTLKVGQALLEDLERSSIEEDLANLGRPLLVLHAPFDTVVGIDHARDMFLAARHPKSFVSLDQADHLLTDRRDAAWVGSLIAAWADRTLDPPTADAPLAHGEVEAVVSSGFRTEIRAGHHRFVADEPPSLGGTDTGPTPYDLLLSSLGACTAMTLRMYADRKQWPLEEVIVTLRHERNHAKDCAGCAEGESVRLEVIHRTLDVVGDLSAEQRQRLLEIADRCPVHRTLHSQMEVRTTLSPNNG
ncbi:MAG: bifunctional alpha/beta hydrolase/OsmC family protein [Myxococcota bacterium]